MRVIVADDMPIHAREISEGIRARWPGWDVLTAGDGQEIVRLVSAMPVDIVLSDIRMPRMDGLEMLSVVRDHSPDTKIVFITAYPLFEYAQKALKLGATDFLLKPVDMAALIDLLAQLSREDGNGDGLWEEVRRWLDQGFNAFSPEAQDRIAQRFSRGCACAVVAPESAAIPQSWRLAEEIATACGCAVYAIDMRASGARQYAMLCCAEAAQCDRFSHALQASAMRHGFRAGLSPWSADLPRNGQSLWRAACRGAEEAFYVSACVVRRDAPAASPPPDLPSAQKLLQWFSDPSGWQPHMRRLLEAIRQAMPDPAGLVRRTRDALQDCARLLVRDSDAAGAPVDDKLAFVVYFNEYRACLEPALEALEARYRLSIERADPVETAKNYVHEHYMNPITLSEVAEFTRLSPNYFSTLFRKSTSMRFMEYVLQVRLEKASEMLANTDMYVYEIANACGYEDVRYFVRVYQKAYGISPASFRRCFRSGKPE